MSITPAPWKAYLGKDGAYTIVSVPRKCIVVFADAVEVNASQRHANAALIAAAPELLEACIKAAEFFQSVKDVADEFSDVEFRDPILDALNAAIAKAKGEA